MLMISKIEDLYSNDDAALKLAREREAAEKERLQIARNRAYNDAISEADRMFDQRLYRDAIEYFELALTIKSFEPYPQKQIYLIKKILAKLQLQGESYNDYIRKADAAFYNKEYKAARAMYVQAHELISDEQYALHKIETIDRILENSKNENEIAGKYSNFIKTADQLYGDQLFEKALSVYQQASKLKPTESYPRSQIKKIRGILSQENDEQKRLLQLQNNFDDVIVKADNAFNQQSYTSARSLYQKALQILPGQEYPLSQLDKIDRILKEKERINANKSKLEQIDFSNLQNVSQEDREAAYNEAMALGESFIKSKEWGIARFYFRRALALYSHDESATNKLAFVDQKIRGDNVNESKYNEMIKKADEAFNSGDFAVAKFYYSKAKEANPKDESIEKH
jgi:tetratricopeptide (TPR) repeat protein